MSRILPTALVTATLLAACGGGGSGDTAGGAPHQPAAPCQNLGYGAAPAALAGVWDYDLVGTANHLYLFENGTFVDRESTGDYPGFWGVNEQGTMTVRYSLTSECPPTGSLLTAGGVTAESTEVSGTIVSSPMPSLANKAWSLHR
jgi:hypothetical protein